jgi:hypothetical protein
MNRHINKNFIGVTLTDSAYIDLLESRINNTIDFLREEIVEYEEIIKALTDSKRIDPFRKATAIGNAKNTIEYFNYIINSLLDGYIKET